MLQRNVNFERIFVRRFVIALLAIILDFLVMRSFVFRKLNHILRFIITYIAGVPYPLMF